MTGIMSSTNTTYQYPCKLLNESNISLLDNESETDTETVTVTDTELVDTTTEHHCFNSYEEVASDLNTSYITYPTTLSDDLISFESTRTISCGDTEGFCFI